MVNETINAYMIDNNIAKVVLYPTDIRNLGYHTSEQSDRTMVIGTD